MLLLGSGINLTRSQEQHGREELHLTVPVVVGTGLAVAASGIVLGNVLLLVAGTLVLVPGKKALRTVFAVRDGAPVQRIAYAEKVGLYGKAAEAGGTAGGVPSRRMTPPMPGSERAPLTTRAPSGRTRAAPRPAARPPPDRGVRYPPAVARPAAEYIAVVSAGRRVPCSCRWP